ncbi:MAG: hypothetical protein KDI56_04260 [Xanthomonadales bacterium]|nr:hypothetical protein [Xanthomonadales bacterium]
MIACLGYAPILGHIGDFFGYFFVAGAWHASAIVLALRQSGRRALRLLFVALVGLWSLLVPWVGLLLAGTLLPRDFPSGAALPVLFGLSSATGAASYWLLIRWWWLPSGSRGSVVWVVASCTLVSTLLAVSQPPLHRLGVPDDISLDFLPTVLWWFAFSGALCLSQRIATRACLLTGS